MAAKAQRMYQNVLRPRHDGIDRRRYCDNKPKRQHPADHHLRRGDLHVLKKGARPAFKGLWDWVNIVSIPTANSYHSLKDVTPTEHKRFLETYGGDEDRRHEQPAWSKTWYVASTIEGLGWDDVAEVDLNCVSPPNNAFSHTLRSHVANRTCFQQERDYANPLENCDESTKI